MASPATVEAVTTPRMIPLRVLSTDLAVTCQAYSIGWTANGSAPDHRDGEHPKAGSAGRLGTVPDGLTDRLKARIRLDFPNHVAEVESALGRVASGNQDRERILAAVVVMAQGDRRKLDSEIKLSNEDWRDVLMGTGLENADWPDRLDHLLGRSAGPH
jgi:hypothetical protein